MNIVEILLTAAINQSVNQAKHSVVHFLKIKIITIITIPISTIVVRERPFNLKGGGGGGGGYVFFLKNILIPNVAEKNILIMVEEKKNNLIQSFCYIT